MKFKVGMLLSYDYELLKNSIPIIYSDVDEIYLSKDQYGRTWKNSKFTIDSSFFDWLKNFDSDKKIKIYCDDFYKSELNTIENESRQRTMLANKISDTVWYIQLDPDEYFINFKGFLNFLKKQDSQLIRNKSEKIQIACFLSVLYKNDSGGYFYVSKPLERVFIATNYPCYKYARMNNTQIFYLPFLILHQSWARKKEDLIYKINNWGHSDEFDTKAYIDFWDSINKNNFFYIKNFHPTEGKKWKKLGYIKGTNIQEIISNLKKKKISVSKFYVLKKNLGQCIKHFNFNPLFRNFFN